MTEEQDAPSNEPPRMLLYALYTVMLIVLVAVFVIVGVYGT